MEEKGNIDAIRHLAVMYHEGKCVERNAEKAFEYYLKLCELGDSEVMFKVSECYLKSIRILFESSWKRKSKSDA